MAGAGDEVWDTTRRRVDRAVGFADQRAERPGTRPALRRGEQLVDRAGLPLDVGVGDEHELDVGIEFGDAAVHRAPVAEVAAGADQRDGLVVLLGLLGCAVVGAVVGDDDLRHHVGHGVETAEESREVITGGVGHRDDG